MSKKDGRYVITDETIAEGNFPVDFDIDTHLEYDEEKKELIIKEVHFIHIEKNDLTNKFCRIFKQSICVTKNLNFVIFKNCIFDGDNHYIGTIHNFFNIKLEECYANFDLTIFADELYINNCKSNLSVTINCNYLQIKDSKINVLNTYGNTFDKTLIVTFEINNSSIKKIKNIFQLFKNNTVVLFDDKSHIETHQKFNYNILRKCAINNNDTVQSLIFYKKLLKIRLDELKQSHESMEDRILLSLQEISNNFGLSIFRPIALMILCNFIFLTVFYISDTGVQETIRYLSSASNFSFSISALSALFNINPLASFYEIGQFSSDTVQHLDYIRRTILAVLIYQTIVAARRFSFVKK